MENSNTNAGDLSHEVMDEDKWAKGEGGKGTRGEVSKSVSRWENTSFK